MTVALAALSAALAVALVLAITRLRAESARLKDRVAAEEAARERAESAAARSAGDAEQARRSLEEVQRSVRGSMAAVESGERLRIEREWSELAGPSATLPAAWDGTLACVVANELEIIREVVGTPSTLEIDGSTGARADGAHAGDGGTRDGQMLVLSAEFVREAARASDEMRVRVAGDVVVFGSAGSIPSLGGTRAAAERAGADLMVEAAEGGFVATLRFSRGA